MGGRAAIEPEVVRVSHQARAEMVVPNSIHHDAGEERIVRACDPGGEFQPALCFRSVEGQIQVQATVPWIHDTAPGVTRSPLLLTSPRISK